MVLWPCTISVISRTDSQIENVEIDRGGRIAATARVHGWTLVSRNVKDFEGTGVSVLNPFDLHG